MYVCIPKPACLAELFALSVVQRVGDVVCDRGEVFGGAEGVGGDEI